MKRVCLTWLISVCFGLTVIAQSPITTPASRTGSITGRVVTDDGQPLPKVRVQLGQVKSQQSTTVIVQTDTEGNFAANGLSAGVYAIYAQMPGYIQPEARGEPRYYRLGDFVTLTLTKGGVITGRVEDEQGMPLVKARVQAYRVRTLAGLPLAEGAERSMPTDDRGIYRLYGLVEGVYQVGVVAGEGFYRREQLATFYPSGPRATAAEITVQTGSEASGIDIRLRRMTGFTVSGTVTGVKPSGGVSTTWVSLYNLATHNWEAGSEVRDGQFAALGVPEGDYEIRAASSTYAGEDAGPTATSAPQRVSVRGADVSGIALQLYPLASLKGRLVLEPYVPGDKRASSTDQCPATRATLAESIVIAQAEGNTVFNIRGNPAVPDEQGQFQIRTLEPGTFRLKLNLPAPTWYVRKLTGQVAPAATAARNASTTSASQSSDQITLKPGQTLENLVVTIATNGARLQGRVTTANQAKLPASVRVHLIPAESMQAEELLRYDETLLNSDGTFHFDHVAPGKYWLLAQPVSLNEPIDRQRRLQVWDAATRARLRKDAELASSVIEARLCSRLNDVKLEWKK